MIWTALIELGVLVALVVIVVWAIRRKPGDGDGPSE